MLGFAATLAETIVIPELKQFLSSDEVFERWQREVQSRHMSSTNPQCHMYADRRQKNCAAAGVSVAMLLRALEWLALGFGLTVQQVQRRVWRRSRKAAQ